MFKGSIVALITPFKNNKLDEDCYISFFFAVSAFLSWSTTGFGSGKMRSEPKDGDVKMIENTNKITLSLTRFFINLR